MKPSECLEGLSLHGGWKVKSIIRRLPNSTGGHFSIGYLVEDSTGREAFLKALDFSGAFQSPDPPRKLQAMTTAYNFERDLLAKCENRSLRRIVTPISDGTVNAPGNHGLLGNVPYLIFDLASGDLRGTVQKLGAFDLAWSLRTLHQTTIGLRQLHSVGIAHQDLKPSNVLLFADSGAKVADLGRASDIAASSETDRFPIPGDVGYAPPEQTYGWRLSSDFYHRYIADLYHLGSMLFFLTCGISATHALHHKISVAQNKSFTRTDFLRDLPYIENAFVEILVDLRSTISPYAQDLTDEIVLIAEQLCQPDPRRRGDSKVRSTLKPQHDLQSYVSRFDRLARRTELRFK
ncbi:MAG: protein kinase [Bacteroidales bacterium]|nr:protein kinase [Candidatus Latescibacterota bacterium]